MKSDHTEALQACPTWRVSTSAIRPSSAAGLIPQPSLYAYDPFGDTFTQTGALASENPFKFSTKYYDEESGLYYYGYRYYHPDEGRWMSRDPMGEQGGQNLYVFVDNIPTVLIDPRGQEAVEGEKCCEEPCEMSVSLEITFELDLKIMYATAIAHLSYIIDYGTCDDLQPMFWTCTGQQGAPGKGQGPTDWNDANHNISGGNDPFTSDVSGIPSDGTTIYYGKIDAMSCEGGGEGNVGIWKRMPYLASPITCWLTRDQTRNKYGYIKFSEWYVVCEDSPPGYFDR